MENQNQDQAQPEIKRLTYSERKDRLTLVVSLIGALVAIFAYLYKAVGFMFTTVYVKDFPMKTEHFIVVILLASGVMVVGYLLRYLYVEFHTFAHYESETEHNNYIDKANRYYLDTLRILSRCFTISVVALAVLMIIFNTWTILYISGCLVIGLILGGCLTLIRKKSGLSADSLIVAKFDRIINSRLMQLARKIPMFFIAAWLFVGLIVFLVVINISDINGKVEVQYVTPLTPTLNLVITNKVPKELNLTIYHESNLKQGQSLKLVIKDYEKSFVEATGNMTSSDLWFQHEEPDVEVMLNKTRATYKKKVDLTPYLKEGNNYVVTSFDVSNGLFDKHYRIMNQIVMQKGSIRFNEDKAEVTY